MKRLRIYVVGLLCLVNYKDAQAQVKVAEGVATFQYEYPDSDAAGASFISKQVKKTTVFFKQGNTRIEDEPYIKDTSIVWIIEPKTRDEIQINNGQGDKIAVKMTRKQREENLVLAHDGKFVLKIPGDTKLIAGYSCKKAIVTFSDSNSIYEVPPFEIWFTDQIAANSSTFKGINGFVMESKEVYNFNIHNLEEITKFTIIKRCTKVEQVKNQNSVFQIPEGYKIIPWD